MDLNGRKRIYSELESVQHLHFSLAIKNKNREGEREREQYPRDVEWSKREQRREQKRRGEG